ncbi:pleckstrin homology domain-containing family A member 8-like isoform X2 [Lethenteron reissneri]|uniref:pleckstrin homology domain-containing family A member 8-like isoform X2 n=1 Tax=Lethenteron reissneri TaxID=7753 RepID=UPI002AB693AC|nr:pleckstrin homology domain-containing family A member 8-like isoform X2 [Lethenteron reissneri]
MEGVLYKWTNYYNGWQPRWFVLDGGVLSYYDHKEDVRKGSKGSLKMAVCEIQVCPSDDSRLELVIPGEQHFYLRTTSAAERQGWVVALGSAKACLTDSRTRKEKEIMEASDSLCSKMSEMRLYYDLMTQQVSLIRQGIQEPRPDVQRMSEASSLLSATCDTFVRALEECVHTAASSVRPSTQQQQQQQQLAPPAVMSPTPRSPQRPARVKSQGRTSHTESTTRSLPRPPPSSRKREPNNNSNKSGRTSSSSSSSRRRLAMASTRVGAIVEEVEEEAAAVEAPAAEGASRPEPTAAAAPREHASQEAAASGESRDADTPQQGASHDASHDADTPQQAVSRDADMPQQAASRDGSHDADTPQQAASHDASHDADTPQQATSRDADTPQQATSHDASRDADTPQQAASHDADTPQQAASHDADTPNQTTTPLEVIAGSDVCPRFETSDVATQESRRPAEHRRDGEDSTVDGDDPNAAAADDADDADSINDGHFDDADDGNDADDGDVGTAGRGEEGGAGENSDAGHVADRGFHPETLGEGEDCWGEGEDPGVEGEDAGGEGEDGGGEDSGGETVETFFGVMAQRFSDAELQDEQGIHVEPFLRACASIVPVLDKLGPTAFAPVKLDFVGNIRKITQKYETDRAAFPTLQSIVGHELSSGTALVRNSTTEALLWLRRGLKFLLELLTEVREGQANLHVALSNAYGRTLRRYHGWVVRGGLALRAAPALDGFLAALTAREGDPTGPEFRAQLNRDLDTYLGAMRAQLGALDHLYEQNQLESDRVV